MGKAMKLKRAAIKGVAARAGGARAAGTLLARGADVNARTQDGWTPLTIASKWEYPDVVELLTRSGGTQ